MITRSIFIALTGVLSVLQRAITDALLWCEDRCEDKTSGIWTNEDVDEIIQWIEEQHCRVFDIYDDSINTAHVPRKPR